MRRGQVVVMMVMVMGWMVEVSGDETCEQTGPCVPCTPEEKGEKHCLEFGYKAEFQCFVNREETIFHTKKTHPRILPEPKRITKFVGCVPPTKPSIHFFLFEISSLVLFLLSFNAVASRKRLLIGLYQRRIQSMVEV